MSLWGVMRWRKKCFFIRHLQVDLPYPQRHDRSNSNLQSEPDQKYIFGRWSQKCLCVASMLACFIPLCTWWVFSVSPLNVLGQVLQDCLQLVTYQSDQPTLDVVVGHVDHKDVGRGVWRLVILQDKEKKAHFKILPQAHK